MPAPQNLALQEPIQVFWAPYDPLDLVSDSIDPLGFGRAYVALADRILPGFTTATSQPRYVSMLCAAFRSASAHHPANSGVVPSALRQERLRCVKSFERAWAVACVLASQDEKVGRKAAAGVRGVSYVNRAIERFSGSKTIKTGSFNLLANQMRYGGLGVYSTFLEECHLGSAQELALRQLGDRLAAAFPSTNLPVHDEDRNLPLAALKEWGSQAHLASFTKEEGIILAEALRGGEEAEHADDVRWTALRLLARAKPNSEDEGTILRKVLETLRAGGSSENEAARHALAQLRAVLTVVEPFERFCQASLYLFDAVRGAATDKGVATLARVAEEAGVTEATCAVAVNARQLVDALAEARGLCPGCIGEVESTMKASSVLDLVAAFGQDSLGAADMLREVVRRHRRVQSGKFDRGRPKAAWVELTEGDTQARVKSQRYQLPRSERAQRWSDMGRHPYRTAPALAFARACNLL